MKSKLLALTAAVFVLAVFEGLPEGRIVDLIVISMILEIWK